MKGGLKAPGNIAGKLGAAPDLRSLESLLKIAAVVSALLLSSCGEDGSQKGNVTGGGFDFIVGRECEEEIDTLDYCGPDDEVVFTATACGSPVDESRHVCNPAPYLDPGIIEAVPCGEGVDYFKLHIEAHGCPEQSCFKIGDGQLMLINRLTREFEVCPYLPDNCTEQGLIVNGVTYFYCTE